MLEARQVLYAHNIYYQGREEWGPTSSWEVTWGDSLERFFGCDIVRFNPDLFGPASHADSDAAVLELVRAHETRLLVMISHIGMGWTREFISKPTLAEMRRQGIRVVSVWGDITHVAQRDALRRLSPEVDLNVCTATSGAANRLARRNPILYSWVPISDEPAERKCDCGALVSLAGSARKGRQQAVDFLRANGVEVHSSGGEGVGSLSRQDYLTMLAHPMTLGFSKNGSESVTNARTFEALTQGSVLLEGWGRETAKVLRPYDEYVPWHSFDDLLEQVNRLSVDVAERQRIAENGRHAVARFTHEALWTRVVARIGLGESDLGFDFVHPVDWSTYRGRMRRPAQVMDTWMSAPWFEPIVSTTQRVRERSRWASRVIKYRTRNWPGRSRRQPKSHRAELKHP